MRFLIQAITCLALAMPVLTAAPTRAQSPHDEPAQPTFKHSGVAGDADRYESYLKKNWQTQNKGADRLVTDGQVALAKDPRLASRHFASAVVTNDKNA